MNIKINCDQLIQKAVDAHKDGKFKEAENFYHKILKVQSKHPDANHNLGIIELTRNNLTVALPLLKNAIEYNPKKEQFWISYINALIKINQFEEAEFYSRKVIELKPRFVIAHFNLGAILQVLNRLDEAEVSYKKAIEFKPDYAEAYNNLGVTMKDLDKLNEAEINLKKAIKLKPNYPEAYNNLSIVLKKLKRLDEAEASCQKALKLNPNYAQAYNVLGNILQQFNKFDEAEASYKKAILLKPNFVLAHFNLGSMFSDIGKLDEAELSLNKSIKLKPDFVQALTNLGIVLGELGKSEEAIAIYSKVIKIKPDFKKALLNRGKILFEKGKSELSLIDFDLCNTEESRARALASLYSLGNVNEIYKRIKKNSELDDKNIRVASFSIFFAEREKKDNAHNFCKNPMDFISTSNLSLHFKDPNSFISEIIKEIKCIKTIWEPPSRTTRNGFHSGNNFNLLKDPVGKLKNLKSIILDELDTYYSKFQNESCSYIKKWPNKKDLTGWYVILKKQGYQMPHIHPGGWLSGVIYLKVVPSLKKNEGAIEFSLNGGNYPEGNSKKIIYNPNIGDIILFPSSLHHGTIPFVTDMERIIVSFDLIPNINTIKEQ